MSGFAAIFRFDGAPADRAALARMVEAIDYRGPDGRAQWAGGGAAMAHLMLHTTAESLEETQPLANEDESLVLVMDGWLANYDELRAELLARGARLRTRADAELVLRAYEMWGEECPKHIDGEYAFVVWDASRREAFCAKDHATLRPLHYHWNGQRLLIASDLAGVLAAGDFEVQPNLSMLAQHLAFEIYTRDETVWQEVMRLLPAHSMRVGAAGPRLTQHWQPPLEVSIRYPSDEDYQHHYRALLEDSIRRASRSHRPLGCDVSGGHDSSAVFSLAHRLAAEGKLQAPSLRGYTFNFGADADADIDEVDYARAVARHLGAEIAEVSPFMPGLDWFEDRGRADRDLPMYPNCAIQVGLGDAMVADGCRVGLNGEGGDLLLGGYPFYFAEQIAERDWSSLGTSLREDAAALGLGQTARNLYRFGIGPAMPARVRALRRRLRNRPPDNIGRLLLSPAMLRLLEQARLESEADPTARVPNPARRAMLMNMRMGFGTYVRDFFTRHCARVGYEVRSPLYARQLTEFAFAIPQRQRLRAGVNKHLHLRALGPDLPAEVLQRRTKATFCVPFVRQLDRARDNMVPKLLQCGIDWVDPAGLSEFWREFDSKPSAEKPCFPLWAAFGVGNLVNHL